MGALERCLATVFLPGPRIFNSFCWDLGDEATAMIANVQLALQSQMSVFLASLELVCDGKTGALLLAAASGLKKYITV